MTTEKQTRIGVYLTEELATKIRRAAALESADKGTTVSMSRWMREAARRRLREGGDSDLLTFLEEEVLPYVDSPLAEEIEAKILSA